MGTRVCAASAENAVVAGGYWLRRQWWVARVAYRERREAVRSAFAVGVAMLIVLAAPSVESDVVAESLPEFEARAPVLVELEAPARRALEESAASVNSDEHTSVAL